MTTHQKYNYIHIFSWIYTRLPKFRKKQFWMLFCAMVFTAALETISLGSIAFFASAVTDPKNVLSSKYLDIVRQVKDVEFLQSAQGLIILCGLLMLVLVIIKNIVKAILHYGLERYAGALEAYFGEKIINGFLKLPYQWHLTINSADLVNAVQWRVYLGRSFVQPSLSIFNDTLIILIMLIAFFVIQPLISVFALLILGGSAYFIYVIIRRQIDKTSRLSRDLQIAINKESTMAIHGVKDVKILEKEDEFVKKFSGKAVPLAKVFGKLKLYSLSPELILETIGFGTLYLSICIMLLKFDITTAYVTGTMALLAVTAWRVLPAVSAIFSSITIVRNSLPFITNQIHYFSIVESNMNIDRQQKVIPFNFNNKIKFENVSFSYQDSNLKIINNFCFSIAKGDTIGIIGTSGAGKSTLANLLMGLLEPVSGQILIDNEVLNFDFKSTWLKMTGYVSQFPYIYDGTLAENIAFGIDKDLIDRQRVKQCCSMASMDDFIYGLPRQIDSVIGERGVKLSGGQQQRAAIARALYHKPEVMIFDEATSSLDTNSEKAILKTIYSFKGKQTLIIISHRLSTIEDCDKIIWVKKGKIKMIGTPETVLKQYRGS